MAATPLELLQGTLDVLILKSLSWGPRHGYAVADHIRERSGEALRIEEGALMRLQAGARCFERYRRELGLQLQAVH